jgi:hypothetical protein
VNEPARDLESRAAAQEELEAILREAEASRKSGGPDSEFAEEPAPPKPEVKRLDVVPDGTGNVTPASPRPAVKFDRYDIKVPDAGDTRIKAYQVSSHVPVIASLGAVALLLWLFAPSGIQLLRPRAIPDAYVDASTRWNLAVTMQRIDRFNAEQGRMPQSLDELDPALSDVMTYQRRPDGGTILQAPGHKGMITFAADTPPAMFLEGSTASLRRAPGGAR